MTIIQAKADTVFPNGEFFPSSPRLDLLLHQLLDISSQKRSPNGDYAVSLLLLELSWAYQNASNFSLRLSSTAGF